MIGIAAFLITIAGFQESADAAAMYPKWVWSQRLEPTTSDDRLGRSEAQILRMGRKRWREVRNSGADYSDIIFARCLYDRNRKTLAQLSPNHRKQVVDSRTAVWLMANACIALQSTEDGGGTSSVHNPRYARIDVEQMAFELATQAAPVKLRLPEGELVAHIRTSLKLRATATTWPGQTMDGHMPDMKEERKFGKLALRYLDESLRLARRFSATKSRAIVSVLDRWSIGEHEPGLPVRRAGD